MLILVLKNLGVSKITDIRANNIVVIGGANLDIKAYSKNYIRHSSSPGWIEESPGGVGRNISENLASLAQNVIFLSVLSNDHYGRELLKKTKNADVITEHIKILRKDNFRTGIYSAHLDHNGELIGAVNDMRILKEINLEYIENNIDIIKNAGLLVIDCNLEEHVIEYLLKITRENNILNLVEAVSVEKSLKLKDKLDMIDYLRANLDEAEILLNLREKNKKFSFSKRLNNIFEEYSKKAESVKMIISAGKKGVYLFEKENEKARSTHFNALKVKPEDIVETTGAGDSLTAGLAAGLNMQKGIEEAISLGIKAAALTIQSNLTCNPDIAKILEEN
jgi:pseudouridine kinase